MNLITAAEWGPSSKYLIGEKLTPGEALYAPAVEEALTTREILVRIFKETGVKQKVPENTTWPTMWPVNRRQ
jgi:hypothetical protein